MIENAQAAGLPVRQVFELTLHFNAWINELMNLKTNSSFYELQNFMEPRVFSFDKRTKFHPQPSFVEYMPDKRDHSAVDDYEYEAPMLLF